MRVLQLTQRFPPALGGVENHVLNLASKLTESGVTTEVFTTDLLRDIPLQRMGNGARGFPFSVRRFRALKVAEMPHGLGIVAPSMVHEVLSHPPDLIHAHAYGYFPTFVGSVARMLREIPFVITSHSDPGRPSLGKRLFDHVTPAFTLRAADRVIALTASEARYLEHLGVRRDRIRIIPNGVNLGEFAIIRKGVLHGGRCTILFVGRCYPEQKGLEYLIKAMSLLLKTVDAHLNIAGEDWGGVSRIRSFARTLGIEGRVTIMGPLERDQLIRAYASADMLVLPSLFEPFGIVLLEAMAAGLPVVASRVGGIVEVVEDGKTGLLVEPGSPGEIAAALEHLISHPELRRAMGRRGREKVCLYSWDMIAPRIKQVYEEILAKG